MLGIETGLLHDDDDSDLPGLLNFWDNEGDGDSTDDTEENFDNHSDVVEHIILFLQLTV